MPTGIEVVALAPTVIVLALPEVAAEVVLAKIVEAFAVPACFTGLKVVPSADQPQPVPEIVDFDSLIEGILSATPEAAG